MTIASAITAAQGRVADCYTAISNKGGTLPATQNLANMPTAIGSIPTGGPSGKYTLMQRIYDDSNNPIGSVSGFFTDSNNVEYAVVCLDAKYRNSSAAYCSGNGAITNLPQYIDLASSDVWAATETATTNTDLILAYCTAKNYTSSACNHCRSKSFVIDGVTYYGQLPNLIELNDICKRYNAIQAADTSASSNKNLSFIYGRAMWSSNQQSNFQGWYNTADGSVNHSSRTNNYYAVPVLELPNT